MSSESATAKRLFGKLSPREREICHLFLGGQSVQDIGRVLGLSSKTVSNHLTLVRRKLHALSDVQLVKLAASAGLVPWLLQPSTHEPDPQSEDREDFPS
jgi:DNA-binding CsgD family transcriptional regulator